MSIPFEPEPPSPKINDLVNVPSRPLSLKIVESAGKLTKEESRIPIPITEIKSMSKPSITEVTSKDIPEDQIANVEKVKSDVFKEIEITDEKNSDGFQDTQDFDNDTEGFVNIESTMQKEVREMSG